MRARAAKVTSQHTRYPRRSLDRGQMIDVYDAPMMDSLDPCFKHLQQAEPASDTTMETLRDAARGRQTRNGSLRLKSDLLSR
jgi:hypothetical protein